MEQFYQITFCTKTANARRYIGFKNAEVLNKHTHYAIALHNGAYLTDEGETVVLDKYYRSLPRVGYKSEDSYLFSWISRLNFSVVNEGDKNIEEHFIKEKVTEKSLPEDTVKNLKNAKVILLRLIALSKDSYDNSLDKAVFLSQIELFQKTKNYMLHGMDRILPSQFCKQLEAKLPKNVAKHYSVSFGSNTLSFTHISDITHSDCKFFFTKLPKHWHFTKGSSQRSKHMNGYDLLYPVIEQKTIPLSCNGDFEVHYTYDVTDTYGHGDTIGKFREKYYFSNFAREDMTDENIEKIAKSLCLQP